MKSRWCDVDNFLKFFETGPSNYGTYYYSYPYTTSNTSVSNHRVFDENEKEYRYYLNAVGCKKDDIKVTIMGAILEININLKDKELLKHFNPNGKFHLDLKGADLKNVKTNLNNGVLTIIVPKEPKNIPVNIEIE